MFYMCVISKKEMQEIWKPSNKHPVKLLQWEAFGVLWSPMTPTERTVGSRTAKAFRKCHVVARDAFIKRPYKFPFWGYDRLEKLKNLLGALLHGKNTNHHLNYPL